MAEGPPARPPAAPASAGHAAHSTRHTCHTLSAHKPLTATPSAPSHRGLRCAFKGCPLHRALFLPPPVSHSASATIGLRPCYLPLHFGPARGGPCGHACHTLSAHKPLTATPSAPSHRGLRCAFKGCPLHRALFLPPPVLHSASATIGLRPCYLPLHFGPARGGPCGLFPTVPRSTPAHRHRAKKCGARVTGPRWVLGRYSRPLPNAAHTATIPPFTQRFSGTQITRPWHKKSTQPLSRLSAESSGNVLLSHGRTPQYLRR